VGPYVLGWVVDGSGWGVVTATIIRVTNAVRKIANKKEGPLEPLLFLWSVRKIREDSLQLRDGSTRYG
jgi:hypothetical protein